MRTVDKNEGKVMNAQFPHRIIMDRTRQKAAVRCPGCGWGLFNDDWQLADGEGQSCRRCGYSSKMGKRTSLPNRSKVLSPQEAAERVEVSRRTIYTWILQGWLRGHRVGGRWYVTLPDLESFRKLTSGATGKPMPQLWQNELAALWTSADA